MKNQIIVLSGPNGSGKTTCARKLLQQFLKVHEYVNADWIAEEISGTSQSGEEVRPGKIMLSRIKQLANKNKDFAFETTLASRSFFPWIKDLTKNNYEFILHFIWLQSPELAVERVLTRVKIGGHYVPEEVVRRRYHSGIKNFFDLYQPLSTTWKVYDNSGLANPELIAYGHYKNPPQIIEPRLWDKFCAGGKNDANANEHHP